MAVVKISELVVAGAITGAELMEVVQGGVNKKITINDIAGFVGPSFYSTNGALASDRTVDLNGKILHFAELGNDMFRINSVADSQQVALDAFSDTDGGNDMFVLLEASPTHAGFTIDAGFNNGATEAMINGVAENGLSQINYIALLHAFNGIINYDTPPDGATTDSVLTWGGAAINKRTMASLANSGLHAVSGAIRIGGGGATGSDNPLLDDAKIDVDGNSFYIFNGAFQKFEINPTGGSYRFGDVTLEGNGMQISIQDDQSFVEIGRVTGTGGNNTQIRIQEDTQVITLTAANGSVMPHIVGGGSAPTIAAGAGAGTTPTVSIGSGSTDIAGFINITTGTLPTGTNAVVVTITFNTTYGSAPTSIILTPANALTALLSGVTAVCVPQSTISATTFTIVSGSTALTGSTAYKFFYQVIK